ncbi:MAG: lysophospholipid acyltransferase family protein [Pseudomonadota bacterium]
MTFSLDGLGRWLRHSPTGRQIGGRLGAFYIRIVTWTVRWQVEGQENLDAVLARGCGFIPSIWHGRLFMSATFAPPRRRTVAMISNNRDGDLISAIVWRFGVFSVRGSTYDHAKQRDKGGREAFSGAYEELTERAAVVAITPDGPRGPRMRAQAGAAALSIATRCPVLPVTFSVRRGKVMRSWDRFLVPWPFGRGVVIYGPVMDPPEPGNDAAMMDFRARIEAVTTEITARADALCDRAPVEPGPVLDGI